MSRSESEEEAVAAYHAALRTRAGGSRSPYLRAMGIVLLLLIVAAVMLPVFQPSPIYSDTNHSLSNMKQLAIALTQYEQDSDDTMPAATSPGGHGWREAIYPFVKSVPVYSRPDYDYKHHNTLDDLPLSFAANHIGPDDRGVERGAFALVGERPVKLTQFTDPSVVIMLASVRGVDGEYWNITDAAFLPQTGRELFAQKPRHAFYERPAGLAMFAYVDGHVKGTRKATAMLAPVNLWTRNNAPFTGRDLQNARAILKHAEDE